MRYLAILKDSWVEALDRKSMWFLVIVSLLVIGFCASISFSELTPEQALKGVFERMHMVPQFTMETGLHHQVFSVRFAPETSTKLGPSAGDFEGGIEVTVKVGPVQEFHRLVHTWDAIRHGKVKKFGDRPPEAKADPVPDPGEPSVLEFFRVQLWDAGIRRVETSSVGKGADELRYRLRVRPESLEKLAGTRQLSLLFGLSKVTMHKSPTELIAVIENVVSNWLGGFFGMLIAIVFTAGIVPNLLQKGTVDVVLARPVTRWGVLLTKYLGSLAYVLVPAVVLIGGCWLALSLRVGVFHPGFLMCIPILVALFAVLQAFQVLMGVLFRSTVASILMTIFLWFVGFLVTVTRVALGAQKEIEIPDGVHSGLRVLSYLLPKTSEINALMENFIWKSNDVIVPGQDFAKEITQTYMAGPIEATLCSIGFIAVNLGLACWIFSRRDQ